MTKQSYEDRRDERFFQATRTALQNIEQRLTKLPHQESYAGAYGVLRGYFESLLGNFAECFNSDQIAEIRLVLDQLSAVTGGDTELTEAEHQQRAARAKALREMTNTNEEPKQKWRG